MEEVTGAKKFIKRFWPDHEVVGTVGHGRHCFPLSEMSSSRVDIIGAKVVDILSLYRDKVVLQGIIRHMEFRNMLDGAISTV